MKISYEDLLSGDLLFVEKVGHLKQPLVKDLKPTQGIGSWKYNLLINVLAWDKEDFVQRLGSISQKQSQIFEKNTKLTIFDMITVHPQFMPMLFEALTFFIDESVGWNDTERKFVVTDSAGAIVGEINRDNYDEVRDLILQMNYINLSKFAKDESISFTSQKAKELWEKSQEYLKKTSKNPKENKSLRLGNIISKLCAVSTGYTYQNIFELTIFQLYDLFFQIGYLHAIRLNETIFANHGGKKFNIQDWLKPLTED